MFDDLARAVLEAVLVDDEVDGRADLLADGPQRQVHAGHEHHRLEAAEHVARGVGVAGRHRAVVAGVHGLEHVERLAGAALPDHDAVGAHAQGVAHELADRDGALALDVRRPRLQGDHVLLAELELGGILDGDDALVIGDERREDVEHRRLAGAGAAGDEDVEAGLHARLEELEHLRRGGAEADQVVDRVRRGGELSDGDDRADERQRRDDGVHARAIGQAGVDHRARLVDATADRGDDALDDLHHVLVVLERHVGELQLALALDVDLLRPVDHHLGEGLVAQERLERAEAQDLVGDLLEHADALGAREGEALLVGDLAEELLDLAPDLDLVRQVELGVQLVDEPVLDAELRLAERLASRHGAREPRRRGPRRSRRAVPAGRPWLMAASAHLRPGGGTGAGTAGAASPSAAGRARSIRFSSDIG